MRKADRVKSFNEEDFLKSIVVYSFDEKKIKSIERFFIFRNLFERELFGTHFSMKYEIERNILDVIKRRITTFHKLEDLNKICSFFKNFFQNESSIPGIIGKDEDLNFNKIGSQFFIDTEDFLGESLTKTIHFLIYFVSRLRNNLFHGIKDVKDIENQNTLFYYANRFLFLCLGNY